MGALLYLSGLIMIIVGAILDIICAISTYERWIFVGRLSIEESKYLYYIHPQMMGWSDFLVIGGLIAVIIGMVVSCNS